MDSRQPPPQLPFTRNAASPVYGRSPFPSNSNPNPNLNPTAITTAPFHPSHPASASPAAVYERRQSDANPFYPQSRPSYAPEPASHPAPTHSRHQSSSSINASLSRNMPPPSPPQHPAQQPPPAHPAHQIGHYGGPPAPRAPPVNLGPPSAFPSARELPALNSIPRTGSTGGSMSISSMLGGPPPAHREPTPGHPTSFPPPATTSAVSGPAYAAPIHASPRMQNANDYSPYSRRPQTPDQGRPFDARDHRGSTAGSPPQGMYGTPELSRYNTPQAYPPRGPPMGPGEERREPPGRISTASVPPRPSSQPRSYHGVPPRSADVGRGPPPGDPGYGRREEARPPGPVEYNPDRPPRAIPFEEQRRFVSEQEFREAREAEFREKEFQEREMQERERRERERMHYEEQRPFMAERERIERERERDREISERQRNRERERERDREMELRERLRRERTTSDPSRPLVQHPAELGPQVIARQQPYGRPEPRDARDVRDPRDPRDPAPWQRPGYDQPPPRDAYGQPYLGPRPGEFPSTAAPPYGAHPAYAQPPPHERFPGTGPPHVIPASQPGPPPSHPFESPNRHRFVQQQPPPSAAPRGRPHEEGPPPPSVAYNGGPGSAAFEAGRRAMDEGPTPAGHPRGFLGIQEINRKGRVSPLPQAVQGAQPQVQGPAGEPGIKSEFGRMFSGIGSGVRGIGVSSPVPPSMQPQFSNAGPVRGDDEHPGHELLVDAPVKPSGRGKRKKAKDEDGKGDDDSTGRVTPVGRAKRPKTHAHHHHHQSAAALSKPAAPGSTVVAKPKQTISSQAVLDSVADRPRKHLGDIVYQVVLKPSKLDSSHSKFGYSSNPRPLPMEVIKGNENSTLTVKIPRVHLSPAAREEITSRRAVWGTDVYTDDSDVVAACIHAGWIRGEWGDDVDVDLLDLYKPSTSKKQRAAPVEQHLEVLTSPPASGPVHVPADRDLHVTLLIMPALEKYSSSTRFGMQSREFGGTYNGRKSIHDGISFMITSVRWVDGAAPQSRLRGKARRERIRKAMSEVNRSQVVDIGEKEILSKMVMATRDVSISKEKMGSGKLDGGNGDGNKENRPNAAAVSNVAVHPPGRAKRQVDTSADMNEAKEKSSLAEGAKMVDTATTVAAEESEKLVSAGASE
ncbi:Rxt3-domain-containing protein [Hypoxylon cercidicola]|nr:Rxt3-domain-containing protein [Hypoxylon cercidicola]